MPTPSRYVALVAPLLALAVLAAPARASGTVPFPYLDPPDVRTQRDVARPTPTPRPQPVVAPSAGGPKVGGSNDWSPSTDLGSVQAPARSTPAAPSAPVAPPTPVTAPATPPAPGAPPPATPAPTPAPPTPPAPQPGSAPVLPQPSLAPPR